MKEPNIYDTTFTYIINSCDIPIEDRLDITTVERWRLTSEWRQPMGSYLPTQTQYFECQTIKYEWGINYISDGVNALDMATMMYSDIPENGKNLIPKMEPLEPSYLEPSIKNIIERLDDDEMLPGAYRDEHDCIPSAGYERSETK